MSKGLVDPVVFRGLALRGAISSTDEIDSSSESSNKSITSCSVAFFALFFLPFEALVLLADELALDARFFLVLEIVELAQAVAFPVFFAADGLEPFFGFLTGAVVEDVAVSLVAFLFFEGFFGSGRLILALSELMNDKALGVELRYTTVSYFVKRQTGLINLFTSMPTIMRSQSPAEMSLPGGLS
jgi:hypothetical protein